MSQLSGNAARAEIQEEINRERDELEQCQIQLGSATVELSRLRASAQISSDDEFERAEAESARKRQARTQLVDCERRLRGRNPYGGLDHLQAEVAACPPEQLQVDLQDAETRATTLPMDLEGAAASETTARNDLTMLDRSQDAALATQKAADALADIRRGADDYINLRLSAEILTRAMDAYQSENRGPLLTRAKEYFKLQTLGEHADLVEGYDSKDRSVLKLKRADGQEVPIEGLSDGTRDQLFLALRLAAIEIEAQRHPFPLILDDVLVNSDEPRAQATLAALAQLSTQTQVLLFTHHEHLKDAAVAAGASLITMDQDAVTGTAAS